MVMVVTERRPLVCKRGRGERYVFLYKDIRVFGAMDLNRLSPDVEKSCHRDVKENMRLSRTLIEDKEKQQNDFSSTRRREVGIRSQEI